MEMDQLEKAINHIGAKLISIEDKLDQIGDGLESLCRTYLADRQGKPVTQLARPATPVNHKCPKCNAKMVERYNKSSGEMFYGCSMFPDCRGTRQSDGTVKNANIMRPPPAPVADTDDSLDYDPPDDNDVPF